MIVELDEDNNIVFSLNGQSFWEPENYPSDPVVRLRIVYAGFKLFEQIKKDAKDLLKLQYISIFDYETDERSEKRYSFYERVCGFDDQGMIFL
jgi:hypothetical protein